MPKEKEVKKVTLGRVLSWIFGVTFGLAALGAFADSVIAGLMLLVMAAVLLPPVNKLFKEKMDFELSKRVKIAVIIIGFIVIGVTISTKPDVTPSTQLTQQASQTPSTKLINEKELVIQQIKADNNKDIPHFNSRLYYLQDINEPISDLMPKVDKGEIRVEFGGGRAQILRANVYEEGWINKLVKNDTPDDTKAVIKKMVIDMNTAILGGDWEKYQRIEWDELPTYKDYLNRQIEMVYYVEKIGLGVLSIRKGQGNSWIYDPKTDEVYVTIDTIRAGSFEYEKSYQEREIFDAKIIEINRTLYYIVNPESWGSFTLALVEGGLRYLPPIKSENESFLSYALKNDFYVFSFNPSDIKDENYLRES